MQSLFKIISFSNLEYKVDQERSASVETEDLDIGIGSEDRSVEADDVCETGDEDADPGLRHGLPEPLLHRHLAVRSVPRVEDDERVIQA